MRSRVHDTLDTASQMIHDKFCGGVCSAAHLEIESLRDAQATIAALQARVRELEQWVQDQSTANLEKMQHMDEMQSRALEAESQLTQRTAERDTARRRVDELEAREVDVVLLRDDLAQRTAELARVRDQYADLRKMVLALPKVEGEITANSVCTIMMHGLYCEEFTKLLQHRQGMEG